MAKFIIRQYEITTFKHLVEADSEAGAIKRLFDGESEGIEGGEYVETAEDLGLPADEYPELVAELSKLGIRCDVVIPSIAAIEKA